MNKPKKISSITFQGRNVEFESRNFPTTEEIKSADRVFSEVFLKKEEVPEISYTMGIDVWDTPNYCLVRKCGDAIEIVLQKSLNDEIEFKKEVINLAKYFDANILFSGEEPWDFNENNF